MFLVAVAASASSKVGRADLFFCSAFGAPLAPWFSADGIPTVLVTHKNAKNCLFQRLERDLVAKLGDFCEHLKKDGVKDEKFTACLQHVQKAVTEATLLWPDGGWAEATPSL